MHFKLFISLSVCVCLSQLFPYFYSKSGIIIIIFIIIIIWSNWTTKPAFNLISLSLLQNPSTQGTDCTKRKTFELGLISVAFISLTISRIVLITTIALFHLVIGTSLCLGFLQLMFLELIIFSNCINNSQIVYISMLFTKAQHIHTEFLSLSLSLSINLFHPLTRTTTHVKFKNVGEIEEIFLTK